MSPERVQSLPAPVHQGPEFTAQDLAAPVPGATASADRTRVPGEATVDLGALEAFTPRLKRFRDTEMETQIIDTSRESFSFQDIEHRRFVFNPKTEELVLGPQRLEVNPPSQMLGGRPDGLVRGYVGKHVVDFRQGFIRFMPPVDFGSEKSLEAAYRAVRMFEANGATDDTILLGFGPVSRPRLGRLRPAPGMDLPEFAKVLPRDDDDPSAITQT